MGRIDGIRIRNEGEKDGDIQHDVVRSFPKMPGKLSIKPKLPNI